MEHITDHKDRAIDRLITQYRTKDSHQKVVGLFGPGVQEVEDVLWAMFVEDLETAGGAQLDVWGRIVGLVRASAWDDEVYRLWIKVRMLILRSGGDGDAILNAFAFIFPECSIQIEEQFPAAFLLRMVGSPPELLSGGSTFPVILPAEFGGGAPTTIAAFIAGLLRACKAAGVRAVAQWITEADAETFRLDDGPGLDEGHLADDTLSV